jgi:hypothetical protein
MSLIIFFIVEIVVVSAFMVHVLISDLQDARSAGRKILSLRDSMRRKEVK